MPTTPGYVFRDADGPLSSRRGFTTAEEAAAGRREQLAARRSAQRVRSSPTFGDLWFQLLDDKRPYLTAGSGRSDAARRSQRIAGDNAHHQAKALG